jgi:hypothetical protein
MALREVKVTFTNGSSLVTSMAAHLTNKEIRDYYKKGKVFNVGAGSSDRMTRVKSVRILK